MATLVFSIASASSFPPLDQIRSLAYRDRRSPFSFSSLFLLFFLSGIFCVSSFYFLLWREMSYPTIIMTNSYAFMAFFLFRSMESEYYSTGASTKKVSLWSNDMRRMLFMRLGREGLFVCGGNGEGYEGRKGTSETGKCCI